MTVTWQRVPKRKARFLALQKEIDSINIADKLYWNAALPHTGEAMAEYQRRKNRLEEIGSELAQMRN